MADLLGIGTSALRAAQQALSTTGHNISNVNTEGYSRQRAELTTLPPQQAKGGYLGSGVNVASIERSHSEFIEKEILRFSASSEQSQAFYQLSARMDNLLADSDNGLNKSMEQFFAAMQDVANNPAGLPERSVLIGEARGLEAQQRRLYDSVENLNLEVNSRMSSTVGEINQLADSIAQVSQSIVAASFRGESPNDLLDQRDVLLRELSSKVSISLHEQENGNLNVFIGNGHGLVVGSQVRHIKTVTNPFDSSRQDIGAVGAPAGTTINGAIRGGELQGLLDFRQQMLDPAMDKLGLLSLGLTETVNQQHQLGVDLAGAMGGEFFSPPGLSAGAKFSNSGSSIPDVTLTDVSQMSADRYHLVFNAGNWQLTRDSDGAAVSGPGPLSMDGFSVDLSAGVPAEGDSFIIQPARSAAAQFSVALTDPTAIAAAAPLYGSLALANSGTMTMGQVQATASTDLPLGAPISMVFNPDAMGAGLPGFDVSGAVTLTVAYDPAVDAGGASFSLGLSGVSFNVAGVPRAGDRIEIAGTGAGSGDNRNVLALSNLSATQSLEGGVSSLRDVYGGLVSKVATTTAQAEVGAQIESSLLAQVDEYRGSISGVNLDEEAANLLRFQQQYQAAAQLITTADMVFNTVLNAARGG